MAWNQIIHFQNKLETFRSPRQGTSAENFTELRKKRLIHKNDRASATVTQDTVQSALWADWLGPVCGSSRVARCVFEKTGWLASECRPLDVYNLFWQKTRENVVHASFSIEMQTPWALTCVKVHWYCQPFLCWLKLLTSFDVLDSFVKRHVEIKK